MQLLGIWSSVHIYGYLDACLHCMALLCIQLTCEMVFGPFFSCLVCGPIVINTLNRKKKNLIIGTLGVVGTVNFIIMGTQNGSNYEL